LSNVAIPFYCNIVFKNVSFDVGHTKVGMNTFQLVESYSECSCTRWRNRCVHYHWQLSWTAVRSDCIDNFGKCSCVFRVITLVWANQRNFFENATTCSKRMRKTLVATQLYWPVTLVIDAIHRKMEHTCTTK